jgi:glycosyltransferase involved in cell wall biosynthesis
MRGRLPCSRHSAEGAGDRSGRFRYISRTMKAARTATKKPRRTAAEAGLSIIIPVLNEAYGLPALHERIATVAQKLYAERGLAIEVVYVDDGSTDATYRVARGLPADALDVQVVALSRNFGKEAALLAGLEHARFGAVAFMDGDGQHPPELLERLAGYWLDDDYDVVYTAKVRRDNEPWQYRFGVRWFYSLVNWGSSHKIPDDAGDFRLLSPRATAALRRLPERSRFLKGLSSWIGFRQIRVDYEPAARAHGRSNFNIWTLTLLSIEGLTSFSVAPLRVASLLGILLAVGALLFGAEVLIETFLFGKDVPGYPSLVVSIMVIGGMQLFMIGVLGEYIGKMLSEAKQRPVYFVAEHLTKSAERRKSSATPARAAE